MLKIEQVDVSNRAQVRRFIDIPYRLYADDRNWVPPLRLDVAAMLNPKKHPYYEHSEAGFFIATRDGRDVGRIAALENRRFNEYHGTREGEFYFFECENDPEAASLLFDTVFEWESARGLEFVIGPKGLSLFDAYGFLERGFEHRQTMTMLGYNPPYYIDMAEAAGFRKEMDFVSHLVDGTTFQLADRIERIAERTRERSGLRVHRFSSKSEIKRWAERIARTYNRAFVDNWEYVPLTDREIEYVVDTIMLVARPELIKVILAGDEVVGFVLTFPDISRGMQRARGRLLPFGLAALLVDIRRSDWVVANGMGILPEFQRIGGPALLYSELAKTLRSEGFARYEITQIAETAVDMRRDLERFGGMPHKNHRVFRRAL